MATAGATSWWRKSDGGIEIFVRLTPKSSREAIDGFFIADDGTAVLKVRVRAIAEGGKANTALLALIAKTVGKPKSAVNLRSGATSRLKTVAICCEVCERVEIVAALEGDR